MIDPRAKIGAALTARSGEGARAFARVIPPDEHGAAPCWGDLAEHFDQILPADDARIDAFEGLRAAGDLSALLVFLDLNRARPSVLAHVWTVAADLPATIQCALVSLDTAAPVPVDIGARLHPAARALIADPSARERDHEFYAAQAAALRAFRSRAPQVSASTPPARTP